MLPFDSHTGARPIRECTAVASAHANGLLATALALRTGSSGGLRGSVAGLRPQASTWGSGNFARFPRKSDSSAGGSEVHETQKRTQTDSRGAPLSRNDGGPNSSSWLGEWRPEREQARASPPRLLFHEERLSRTAQRIHGRTKKRLPTRLVEEIRCDDAFLVCSVHTSTPIDVCMTRSSRRRRQ